MKIKLFLHIVFLCIIPWRTIAQNDSTKKALCRNYISLSSGIAHPTSDFSGSVPGFGNPVNGIATNIYDFLALSHSVFGIAAMMNYEVNSSLPTNYYPGYNMTSSTNYNVFATDIGLAFDIPIHKFYLDFRALVGPAISWCPSFNYSNYLGSPVHIGKTSAYSSSFDLGVGIRYSIFKKISLSVGYDIFLSNPSFNIPNSGDISTFITLRNINTGITYSFGEYVRHQPYIPSFVDSVHFDIPEDTLLNHKPKITIFVNAGPSLPGNKFGGFNSDGIGGADNGSMFFVSAEIPVNNSHAGIALMGGGGYNYFSVGNFDKWINENTGNIAVTNLGSSTNISEAFGMIGAYFTIPCQGAAFDFRALFGGLNYSTPAVDYICYQAVYQGTFPNTVPGAYLYSGNISSTSSLSLSFDIGASCKITIKKNFYLLFNFDYMNTPADIVALTLTTAGLGCAF